MINKDIDYILLMVSVTFVFTALIMPFMAKIANYIGAMDIPRTRHIHTKPMPKLGGLGIFLGFLFGYMLFGINSIQMNSVLIGSFIIVITGIIDDIRPIKFYHKLIGQIAAAAVIVFYGQILLNHATLFGLDLQFGIFAYPITLLFIVGCINIMNLIDGMDGLCGGITSIFFITIGIICFFQGRLGSLVAIIGFIMLGSTLGFLLHNFYPAKIFSGDSGSMFQGFMIAVISLLGFKTATMISLFVPILILGIPILDTLFAIIRRSLKHQPIYMPDKCHLHHQLLSLGLSHRNTVLAIYAMNILFAIASIIYITGNKKIGIYVYLTILALILWIVFRTGIISEKNKLTVNKREK